MSTKSKLRRADNCGTVFVRTEPEQVRIDLLDHQFQTATPTSFGELRARVPVGLYQLVFDTGLNIHKEIISVEAGPEEVAPRFVQVAFPSSAPIPGTLDFRPEQATAAAELSHSPGAGGGGAGRLMIFVRVASGSRSPTLDGLTLLDEHLADATGGWSGQQSASDWCGWCGDLQPGGYLLRWRFATPEKSPAAAVDQSLWISPGWVTCLFVMAREAKERLRLDRETMSIHQTRLTTGFAPFDEYARSVQLATELAMVNWRTRRCFLHDDSRNLDVLLDEKYANPLLGILAAHSLWQSPEPDYDLLRKINRALQSVLPDHPDTIALNVVARHRGLSESLPEKLLSWPPIFEASLQAVIATDWQGADRVLDPEGLITRATPELLPGEFWTCWLHGRFPGTGPKTRAVPDESKSTFLGYWLADSLHFASFAEVLPSRATDELGDAAAQAFWMRFAASSDPILQRLAQQVDSFYESWKYLSVEETEGTKGIKGTRSQLYKFRTLSLADLAQSFDLPRPSLVLSLVRWLLDAPPEAPVPISTWPPVTGRSFVRSETFGHLLLDVVDDLIRRAPSLDYTDAVAHVFSWFDGKLRQNRSFINLKRFPTEAAFRAYLRRAAVNASLMAARRQRTQEPLSEDLIAADLTDDPSQSAQFQDDLDVLPQQHREAIRRLFFADEDFQTVADSLRLTSERLRQVLAEAAEMLVGTSQP